MLKALFVLVAVIVAILIGGYFYLLHTPAFPMPALPGAYTHHALESSGRERTFAVYQPVNLAAAPGVIFVLHGSQGTGEQMRHMTGYEFDVLAEEYGFLVVYPDGYENHWNDCRGSADYAANVEDIDDPTFLADVVTQLQQRHNADRLKVFATGLSNGGHMVYRLGLEQPAMFGALAAIGANLPVADNRDCLDAEMPVSMAIFNGTEDPVNPYDGGLVSLFGNDSRGHVLSSNDTAAFWRTRAQLPDTPDKHTYPEVDGDTTTSIIEERWGSADTIQVRLYTLVGAGHVVPSQVARFPRMLGGDARDISGPREIVNFFLQSADRTVP